MKTISLSSIPRITFSLALAVSLAGLFARPANAQVTNTGTCITDQNCASDETCQITGGSSGGSAGCAPGETCVDLPAPMTTIERNCVGKPRACMLTSDCPFPLVCNETSFDGGDDRPVMSDPAAPPTTGSGGAPAPLLVAQPEPPVAASKVCTWKVIPCQATSDCGDPRLDCIEFDRFTSCNGGGGIEPGPGLPPDTGGGTGGSTGSGSTGTGTSGGTTTDPAAAPGDAALVAPPTGVPLQEPLPTDCTETVIKACFPKVTACNTAFECLADWVCHDFSGSPDAPFFVAGTRNHFCIPQGIVLALDGKAQIDASSIVVGRGDVQAGSGEGSSLLPGGVNKGGGNPTATGDDTSTQSSGGCAVAGGGDGLAGAWWLALVGLTLALRRRRA